ncbi:hypothetical protein O3P69_013158 [Scylla paramamosain]|uniref:THAP-type domain-containing protein n=1 Tax=Scylla paramamosain TaxID=85552 RepID=A0AAW0TYU2_SCYPA
MKHVMEVFRYVGMLPKDPSRRKEWLAAIRRDNYTPGKQARLCSKHFRPDDFDRTSLCYFTPGRKREHVGFSEALTVECTTTVTTGDWHCEEYGYGVALPLPALLLQFWRFAPLTLVS